MNISILIATYGDRGWHQIALRRAYPSTLCMGDRGAHEVLVNHEDDGTVGSSRNALAEWATGDWLCFLDADDELDPGFLEAIERAATVPNPLRDDTIPSDQLLFTPAVSYVRNGRPQPPRIWPQVPIERGNWMVIGTIISRSLFFEVGGFKDYGDPPGSNAYEDWSLWSRCLKAGAQVVKVPRAVYVCHIDMASRHRHADARTKQGWHLEIGMDVFPERYGPDAEHPLRIGRVR